MFSVKGSELMSVELTELPDYPALQQLARALWHNGSVRGAAVLVGAGFSKNADCAGRDTASPPLWGELLRDMALQLYPRLSATDLAARLANPLRLAEEYKIYFGQAVLDDFLRTRLPDRAWQPGYLHGELLGLPWADVLTTNWDTLLERAAVKSDDYVFETVRFEADLPHARAPRIIKLHGTLGDAGTLIFTEEDYRTYPAKHAAFVNVARQVFIENDLCLLGFSGDDPNYLQWAGWVRDQLGDAARRIYLVGCLDLAPAARKFLEARNIAPIDLALAVAECPKEARHTEATQLFLSAMRDAKPRPLHKWHMVSAQQYGLVSYGASAHERARKDDAFAAEALQKLVVGLKKDRLDYPGWLLCPHQYRRHHFLDGDLPWLFRPEVLKRLTLATRAELLEEILWRQTTALQLPSPLLRVALADFLADPQSRHFARQRQSFAIALLRHARCTCDAKQFEAWRALLESEAEISSTEHLELQYQQCLWARDRLDLDTLTSDLAKWEVTDPVWKLRRAALYCEVGQYTLAGRLIQEAATELDQQFRLNRTSLWIKSCLGWAQWLFSIATSYNWRRPQNEVRLREFRDLAIDPYDEIRHLSDEATQACAKQRAEEVEVIPLFGAGHYRLGASKVRPSVGPTDWDARHEMDLLMEVVGIPLRIHDGSICAGAAIEVAQIHHDYGLEWYAWLLRALNVPDGAVFLRYFSRVALAQISEAASRDFIAVIDRLIQFWLKRLRQTENDAASEDRGCATNALRLYFKIQACLTVRMTSDQAADMFHKALGYAINEVKGYYWILESIKELVTYAAEAVSPAQRGTLALSAIEFPLVAEVGAEERVWPDPLTPIWGATPARSPTDLGWAQRIQQLIDAASKEDTLRKDAVHRLTYLSLRGVLTALESQAFAEALWGKLDRPDGQDALPAGIHLYRSLLIKLPAPAGIDVKARVQRRLQTLRITSTTSAEALRNSQLMQVRVNELAELRVAQQFGLPLTPARATGDFDKLVSWQCESTDPSGPFDGFIQHHVERLFVLNGEILGSRVVPAMRAPQRTVDRGKALLRFIEDTGTWSALEALPYFLSVAQLRGEIESVLRRNLVSPEPQRAGRAALALTLWGQLRKRKRAPALPHPVIESLLTAVESGQERGMPMRLRAARALFVDEFITVAEAKRLVGALKDLATIADYKNVPLDSHAAVAVSLIRAECVRLSEALRVRGIVDPILATWLDAIQNDPLPEVRYALCEAT
jgi:hypothetical protein